MNKNNDDALAVVFLIIMLVALAIGLTIAIFFYLTLSRCLSRIRSRNREMEPGQVWLNLIPCFGIIWIFFHDHPHCQFLAQGNLGPQLAHRG
jgi:hypothetical protein